MVTKVLTIVSIVNFEQVNAGWEGIRCVKSVQKVPRISPYSVRMRENKDQKKLRI